jgi:hypothetical protein
MAMGLVPKVFSWLSVPAVHDRLKNKGLDATCGFAIAVDITVRLGMGNASATGKAERSFL